ncbi:MAG TPA: hypothetical protein PKV40_03275 [Candidatus Kapabacteria bacterium]|nr:hypothetical protein [Candidatus Kapabacteria bacterium]HRT67380.1 hypothetical protein [Bacteroidota bacterium]
MDEKKNIEIKKDDPLYKAQMIEEMLKKIEQQVEQNNPNIIKVLEEFAKMPIEKDTKK